MGTASIILIHILIQIDLQGLKVRIDLLPKSNPVELISDRLMDPLTDPIGLRALGLGFCMLNLVELKIQLVRMFIRCPTELSPSVR